MDPRCNWCGRKIWQRYRVYCTDGDKIDYCSRGCAEVDSSAGPKFRGRRIRKLVTKDPA